MNKYAELIWDYDPKEKEKFRQNLAPVVLFVYNRLDHTKKTVAALRENIYAEDSILIVFSDGAKNEDAIPQVNEVRKFVNGITGFKKVVVLENETNKGLAANIITGVTGVMEEFGKAIVLEDGIVTSRYFLKYMNDALALYADCQQVMAVNAYMEPVAKDDMPPVFFTHRGDCWGWGTWARSWQYFEKDSNDLLSNFTAEDIRDFCFEGYLDNWEQVIYNQAGFLNTWAVFWLASIYKRQGFVLQVRDSLVNNIGMDGSGEHDSPSKLRTLVSDKPVAHFPAEIKAFPLYRERIKAFMRQGNPNLPFPYAASDLPKKNCYCTLFDSGYLLRALAMYESLARQEKEFTLYIFAFDKAAENLLQKLALPNTVVIPLEKLEDKELKRLRQERTWTEYCWTCSCHTILYVIEHFPVEEVTYIDADLFFFDSPQRLLDEFHASGKDVLITPHRFSPEYSHLAVNGIYCVQFMTFRNTVAGLNILYEWCKQCREWCYNRVEGTLFGDQGYLNDWPERFSDVHVLHDIGGAGPWNIQQHTCSEGDLGPAIDGVPVVFYHFSGVEYIGRNNLRLMNYRIPKEAQQFFYVPYLQNLDKCLDKLEAIFLH